MDKQMREVLENHAKLGPLPIDELTPALARELPQLRDAVLGMMSEHVTKRLGGIVEPVEKVSHIQIPGLERALLARIYTPAGDEEEKPVLLYFHGGGFVLGGLDAYDSSCRALANAAGCLVVSLAYRQAPEHRYPAARMDAFVAYQWLLTHARRIGGDPDRIAVGGESAGGNLAAVVCLMSREHGTRQPVHQLLIYPVLDSDFETDSYRKFANAKPLNKTMMRWFFGHYLNSAAEYKDPNAFPLQAKDFSQLAPATILTAEIDPLAGEGEEYARQLSLFDVPALHQSFAGVTHEFFGMGAVLSQAREAVALASGRLREAFQKGDSSEAQVLGALLFDVERRVGIA